MNTRIVPIEDLPPSVTGHLEFTHTPAKRDWRDRAIAIATLIFTTFLVMPWVFSADLVRLLIATWVVGYVWIASGELRFFTPFDRRSVRAVIERAHEVDQTSQDHAMGMEENLNASPAGTGTAADSGVQGVNGG